MFMPAERDLSSVRGEERITLLGRRKSSLAATYLFFINTLKLNFEHIYSKDFPKKLYCQRDIYLIITVAF